MRSDVPDVRALVDALADRLTVSGAMTDPSWREVLREVPRHLFAPPVAWAAPGGGGPYRIDVRKDPARWWEAVYAPGTVVLTQFEDGAADITGEPDEPGELGAPTSSLSAPDIVLPFLELLHPIPGQRILDVGTGNGWTAALLCERVGDRHVVSAEVDERVAAQAAANLETAGYAPELIVGDAASCLPDGGGVPFDIVHVTCGVATLPYAWVQRARPGAAIAFPWMPDFGYGYRVRLDVMPDGTALGRLAGSAGYMMMRSQRGHRSTPVREWTAAVEDFATSETRLDPRLIWHTPGGGLEAAMSMLVPGVRAALFHDTEPTGESTLWLLDAAGPGGPWASVDYVPGKDHFTVEQAGDRKLWDEVEAAYFQWVRWGRPGLDRFGLTVAPDGQRVWLDDPVPHI
ncbi:protein-L-isoaspartate(D-aspartate) O-methyltransferase [Thermomonospora echinospora]|uniref:Protein-L-isoaspartate O-methyltransferase n=1 Tax=Thermomonospora echinospora TaxID=1992 RepID=A0A1H6CE29_9ACTN|nr:methyltransferase domain-containing protein [Thermomonospora echinospora]SEG70905.1 protein-L-isoaspartate(D-aspartate) O-methyltransferase [Thermomonospora echinospora]